MLEGESQPVANEHQQASSTPEGFSQLSHDRKQARTLSPTNMTDHSPVSPVRPEESATTREEMSFDDTEQEIGTVSPVANESQTKNAAPSPSPRPRVQFAEHNEEFSPPKPPRPVDPMQRAETTLIEAFPTIEHKIIRAVLVASGGKVEPAFNALLGMSDPDFRAEDVPPPQPPRTVRREPVSQLEADEAYARQLAEEYDDAGQRTRTSYNQREPARRGPNQQRLDYDSEDRERTFLDDDLPEIGRNIQQGFMDTQKKVNSWITNLKKRLDGDGDEEDLYTSSQSSSRQNTGSWPRRNDFGSSQQEQIQGIRKLSEQQRRSTETQRYDADPHEFREDEFERLELRDEETAPPQPPRTSSRKTPNPDLFKVHPPLPMQSGPIDEVEAADRRASGKDATEAEKSKKWQPLTSVTAHPEDDNDPFSLGDDDEEKEKEKAEDLRKEDSDRLKAAASKSTSQPTDGKAPLEENQTSDSTGVKDKTAEELLTGK